MDVPGKHEAKQKAHQINASPAYRFMVRAGLIAFGVVHLLVAYLAVQLSLGGSSEEASQSGALQELSSAPFGKALLAAVAVGFFILTIWMVLRIFIGLRQFDGFKLWRKRLSSAGRAIIYAVLGYQSAQIALGSSQSSGGDTEQSATATLLSVPLGQVLVGLVGLAVIGVGVSQIVKGIRDKYNEDLNGNLSGFAKWAARLGHVAKGISIGIVGILFIIAALNYDADAAGGMDAGLQQLRQAPYGTWLLILVAIGLAWYGIYCFFWAKRAKFD